MLSYKAQSLSVEAILILIIFTAILSILSIYLWGIIQRTTNVIKSTVEEQHYNEFANELRNLYFSGKFGKLKLYVPSDKSLLVGFYGFYITKKSIGSRVIIDNVNVSSKEGDNPNILIIDDSNLLFSNAQQIKNFVKNGGILIIDASKIDVLSYDLFNVGKYIIYDNYTLSSSELISYSKPFYDNFRTVELFKNTTTLNLKYSLLSNVSLDNFELIEYFSTEDKIYPIVFKQYYGLGTIYYSLDENFISWVKNNSRNLIILSERVTTDENSGYFESNVRKIINPLFKKYYYLVYSCSNIMIFSKGFTELKVYKTNNSWKDIIKKENIIPIYHTYFELYTVVPVTSCGVYLLEVSSPSVVYVFSKGGGISVMSNDAIIPVSGYLYVCGINTSFSIIDLNLGKSIIYMDYRGEFGGCYKKLLKPGLYRIKASPYPVMIYSFIGYENNPIDYVDVINPPYYKTANGNKIYIFPQIYIEVPSQDTIINYIAVIYSKPDNKQKSITIYEYSPNYKMSYTKVINSSELLIFTTTNNSFVIVQCPEDVDIQLVPLFYNLSGYLKDLTSHGAILTPDKWIILSLTGTAAEKYKLILYTSISLPKLQFIAFESDYSSLGLFNIYNPNVSSLYNVTNVKFYKAKIYRKVYNCSLPVKDKIFITIDNKLLSNLGINNYCTCYNLTTGDPEDCSINIPHFEKKYIYYIHEEEVQQVI